MKYLMIFSIGPVQEFIATARRSRDLWYGSWMLSELSKAAAGNIKELNPAGELIFPNPVNSDELKPNSKFTAPNKIVAVLDSAPKPSADAVHLAVKNRMNELWGATRINGNYDAENAKLQIDDLVEFIWVSIAYDDSNEENYTRAREQAEALLAARKATRDFKQPEWASNFPKSSLDGARESVIPETEYPRRKDPQEDKKIEALYKNFHARRGEQLSGVDLLKRMGSPKEARKFKSTSDMAAIPFIQWLENAEAGKGSTLIDELRAEIAKSDSRDEVKNVDDGEGLVFESRYEDSFPCQRLTNSQREEFRKTLERFAGNKKPNPYYALLAADGDFMGKMIDEHHKKEEHKRISRTMAEFAIKAPEIVEKHGGIPIYSGGDDVLTYLPLNSALICAQELETAFRAIVGESAAKETKPTLSIGIVIVHHLEPLSDALDLARKAEKEAKKVTGKNGLAVILSKRGGADRIVCAKFADLYKRLTKLQGFFATKAISGGAAYELQELHNSLSKTDIPAAGKALEAARIIERKRESGGDKQATTEVKDALKGWVETIELDDLAREMIVANNLAVTEESK